MSDRIDLGGAAWDAIPRAILRDARLSPKAKGGLVTLLSHDEGWVRSSIAILQRENDCGREQAKAIMRELREAGYAELVTERGLGGLVTTHYIVRAESAGWTAESVGSPGDGKPAPRVQPPEGAGSRSPVSRSPVNRAAVVDPRDEDPLEVQDLHLAPSARARNLLVDALATATGLDPYGMTAEEAKACGVALASIRKASPDVDPRELQRRAGNYATHFTTAITPNALKRQWSKCREPATDGRGKVAVPGLRDHELAEQLRAEGR